MAEKAEVSSQVFVYIAGILITAGILYLGSSLIYSLIKMQEDSSLDTFVSELKEDVREASLEAGSVIHETYTIPAGYDEFCLVSTAHGSEDIPDHPLITDSIRSGLKENAFLSGPKGFYSFYLENLELRSSGYYCTNSGSIKLVFEGDGIYAYLAAKPLRRYCANAESQDICMGLDIALGSGYRVSCCSEYKLCC